MKTAVIVGAGNSVRSNLGYSKIRYKIKQKEIFLYSVEQFLALEYKVVLVVNKNDFDYINNMELKNVKVVIGGSNRTESVALGLNEVKSEYVFIHDAARPNIKKENIESLEKELSRYDAIFLAEKITSSIKKITDEKMISVNRDDYLIAQTPQCFKTEKIKKAYANNKISMTDDIAIYQESYPNEKIGYVINENNNMKITYNEDFKLMENILNKNKELKIGHSYDIHKLVENRDLVLGGVKIPYHLGLLGHSDADALTHAITESIIGALGLGDIGTHFPDSDPKYKDISSLKLLEYVKNILKQEKCSIINIDALIFAEKPKMLPYIAEMKKNISDALAIDEKLINIKSTTYEGLDAIGRNEAIAAEAICLIREN